MTEQRDVYIVSGSSGLLGHALSHRFGAYSRVIGLDLEGPPYPPPNSDWLFCDMTSDESVQKTLFMIDTIYGGKVKAVIHLAAYYSFSGKPSHLYKSLTVDGTDRLLRELKKFNVEQFIFSSSMLAYRPGRKGEKLTEESPLEATWAYPQSKIDTENLIREKHGNIPVVILRVAGVYSNICQSIPLAHQIQRIYENQLEGHLYSGDAGSRQTYVHLHDFVTAVEASIRNADKLSGFDVFNIGEDDALSYAELQESIAKILFGKEWNTIAVPKPIAKAGAWVEEKVPVLPGDHFVKPWMVDRADDNYEMDSSKAKRILDWKPELNLRQTLPIMLEGLKVDPEHWYKVNKLHYHGATNVPLRQDTQHSVESQNLQ